jgi:hypothetical protein
VVSTGERGTASVGVGADRGALNDEVAVAELHVVEALNGNLGDLRVDVLAESEALSKEMQFQRLFEASSKMKRESQRKGERKSLPLTCRDLHSP